MPAREPLRCTREGLRRRPSLTPAGWHKCRSHGPIGVLFFWAYVFPRRARAQRCALRHGARHRPPGRFGQGRPTGTKDLFPHQPLETVLNQAVNDFKLHHEQYEKAWQTT